MKLNQIIGTLGLVVAFAACSKRDAAAPAAPATAEAKKKVYEPILAASHYALKGEVNCNGLADADSTEFNVVLASSDAEKVAVPSRLYVSSNLQEVEGHPIDVANWNEAEYDVEKIENGQMTLRLIANRHVIERGDRTIEKADLELKEEVVSERGFRVNKDGTLSISNPDLQTNGCTFGAQYITLKKL